MAEGDIRFSGDAIHLLDAIRDRVWRECDRIALKSMRLRGDTTVEEEDVLPLIDVVFNALKFADEKAGHGRG